MGETQTKMACFCQFAEFYRLRNEYCWGLRKMSYLWELFELMWKMILLLGGMVGVD